MNIYSLLVKPILDITLAVVAFVLASPLFIFLIILLSVLNQGKPFFFQLRTGKNKKIFKIIKFRTMNDRKDKNGNLLPDDKRLTPAGRFIRKTSLDELPQLINIIKGEMSLVGPRPLLPEYLPLYNKHQNRRHLVKPGITGWAQINGRNNIEWQEKFNLDVYYVKNINFFLDLKILVTTIKKVFVSEGINAQGVATTNRFKGN